MDAKEFLETLRNTATDAISFRRVPSMQKGTLVFKAAETLSPAVKHDIATSINDHYGCAFTWNKKRLVIFPEIKMRTLSDFRNILDEACRLENLKYHQGPDILEKNNLSDRQLLLRVSFSKPASKSSRNRICWKFQQKNGILCKCIANNEFLIDCNCRINAEDLDNQRENERQKKLHADKCGKLARLYGLPFINVLCLGADESLLKRHLLSLERASGLIAAQEKKEKRILYRQLFKAGRETRRKTLQSLGIVIEKADITKMDFSMLKDAFKNL